MNRRVVVRGAFIAFGILVLIMLVGCGGAADSLVPEASLVEDTSPTAVEATVTETTAATATSEATAVPADTVVPADTAVPDELTTSEDVGTQGGMTMQLTSDAFEDGELIPSLYTCDGQDISPPLGWENIPADTRSFALICDDPDAPGRTWVHWVIYNIPSELHSLTADVATDPALPDGTQQGQNSWPRTGYGGPCPPSGTHRYIFTLYALDALLDLTPDDADKAALLAAMEGHILSETALTGLYERQR